MYVGASCMGEAGCCGECEGLVSTIHIECEGCSG